MNLTGSVLSNFNSSANYGHNVSNRSLEKIYEILIPILLLLCLMGIVINVAVLIVTSFAPSNRRSPAFRFAVSLMIADTWVSILMGLVFIVNSYLGAIYNHYQPYCFFLTTEGFRLGAIITAIYHLFIAGVNHYVGIIRPLQYNVTMTTNVTRGIIVILWILPTLCFFLYFGGTPGQGFLSPNCTETEFFATFSFRMTVATVLMLPMIALIFIYGHIFVIIFRSQREMNIPAHMRNKQKAIVTTGLILGTYSVGWLPAIFRFIMICTGGCPFKEATFFASIVSGASVNVLILAKCVADPIIYAVRQKEMRYGLTRLRHKLLAKQVGTAAHTQLSLRRNLLSNCSDYQNYNNADSPHPTRRGGLPKSKSRTPTKAFRFPTNKLLDRNLTVSCSKL